MKIDSFSNPLRWVIVLLTTAVILPTVCLLWFMNQAVKNERLAVRSKLSNVYHGEINRVFGPFFEWLNDENLAARIAFSSNKAYEAFHILASADTAYECDGLFVYDLTAQKVLYPILWDNLDILDNRPELQEAVRLEFVENSLKAALDEYGRVEKASSDPILFKRCKLAQGRILHKMGELEAAIGLCETVQAEPLNSSAHWYYYTTANLKILDLLEAQGIVEGQQAERLDNRLSNLLNVIETIDIVPCEQRVLAFEKVGGILDRYPAFLSEKTKRHYSALKMRMEIEGKSLNFLLTHPDFLKDQPPHRLVEKIADTNRYAVNLYAGRFKAVRLADIEKIVQELSQQLIFSDDICWRIIDSDNSVIAGNKNVTQEAFLTIPMASFLDWSVNFYETDTTTNIFETAARRQTSIYTWTGILVVITVAMTGFAAIRTVGRQIKMNRLKNDFIATVTHELKTPLASMRLLVDTLLEKRYENENTATEYLQMVANENKRLTHLIDSFLTFSRMERKKQVFDFQPVAPGEIARGAVEVIKTKFSDGRCDFSCTVDEHLPTVRADKDGMVTVLVNLLDNACKYTNAEKHIELKVYAQNGWVCFGVKDNGIGIPKRVQKKIFGRFYQVDNRLSRSVEGCGLGLSIVKFIVDAHKGTIELESRPGQGSTFTVKIPNNKE
jgi:signal transduction histidine kinase